MSVSEHRLYLPSIGILLALTGMLSAARPCRALRCAGIVLLVPLASLTWQRSRVWQDELSLWGDAASRAPTMFRAQSNWGLALYDSGRLDEAEQVLSNALRLNAEYARTWSNLGLVREERGALDGAVAAFERALSLDSGLTAARAHLGHVLLRLGQGDAALMQLRQAVAQCPLSVLAWTHLGLALQQLGDASAARQAYLQAISLDPEAADAWNNLGLLNLEQGDQDAARESLQRALEIHPEHSRARINLRGLALQRQGVSRVEACRRVAEEFPGKQEVWVALAQAEAAAGDWDRAAAALVRALERGPDLRLHLQLGGALRRAGRLSEAITAYEEAVSVGYGSTALYNALTAAYAAAGRQADALRSCRQALALDPRDAVARRHLEGLQNAAVPPPGGLTEP